jgi:3'-5' exoribonuclease
VKEQYVARLREGMKVDTAFAVESRELRVTRTGEAYLALRLADRTGSIAAVQFRPDLADVPPGSVARVRGLVTAYRGERRVSVESLRVTHAFEPGDLLPGGPRDRGELEGFLEALRGEVHDRGLRALLDSIFGDPAFFERFRDCPASRGRHHAYLGGLLEHTVSVAALCQQVGAGYPYVDADLLLTAALLHDVGKVEEFVFDTAISYTDEGRLVGHVVLGERMVSSAAVSMGIPGERALRLRHVLLTHHGELEWGSPRRPATLEALILHHVDNLDAKMAGFIDAVTRAAPRGERWTDATNLFRRPLYVPRAAEDDRPFARDEDDEYCMETSHTML